MSGPIIDIGCGRGAFLALLAREGHDVLGVDPSAVGTEACRAAGLSVIQVEALDFLTEDGRSLGGAAMIHVVEHWQPAYVTAVVEALARRLVPGGRLVVATPNVRDLLTLTEIFWLDVTHVRPYPPEWLRLVGEEAGLALVALGSQGPGYRGMGRRRVPQYLWRRLLWGREYGRSEAYVVLEKPR